MLIDDLEEDYSHEPDDVEDGPTSTSPRRFRQRPSHEEFEAEVVSVEELVEFGIVASEPAMTDQLNEDDIARVEQHRDNPTDQPVAQDDQRDS